MFKRADMLVGNGLVLLEGESWLRQRRLLQPPFSPKRIAGIAPRIAQAAMQRVSVWRRAPQALEMGHEMAVFTLTSLLCSMLGIDADAAMFARFDRIFTCLGKHVALRGPTFFLPERFPLPGRRQALAAVLELHQIIDEIVAARRKRSEQQADDLLGLMLAARDDTGQGMSHAQLRDELKNGDLRWLRFDRSGHRLDVAHARDASRIRAARTRGSAARLPKGRTEHAADREPRVPRACVPGDFAPVPTVFVSSAHGDRSGCHRRSAHSCRRDAALQQYAPGRHAAYWEYPDSFYPDHFLPEHVAKRDRFAYVPFAAGPRMCIGMTMALMEARMIFALALRELEIVRPLNTP